MTKKDTEKRTHISHWWNRWSIYLQYSTKGKPRPELSPKAKREIREKLRGYNPHSLAILHYRYYLMIAAYSGIPRSEQAPNLRVETMAIEAILRQTMMLIEYVIVTIDEYYR